MGTALTIGRIAKLAGVNVETIRYYQRRGLVAKPDRLFDSYRRYPPEAVDQILFIKRAQALGFSLDEIAVLLQLDSSTGSSHIYDLVVEKAAALRTQIEDLGGRLDILERLIRQSDGMACDGYVHCPLILYLSGGVSSSMFELEEGKMP